MCGRAVGGFTHADGRRDPAVPASATASAAGGLVQCGPVAEDRCRRFAARALAEASARFPGKTIESLEFTTADGAYMIRFTDGSVVAVTQ